MKIQQYLKQNGEAWKLLSDETFLLQRPLVFVFGNRFQLENDKVYEEIRSLFPDGELIIGSSAGEILGENVYDDAIGVTAIEFEKSTFTVQRTNILNYNRDAFRTGEILAAQIDAKKLKHVLVISEGSFVNGSALVDGLQTKHTSVSFTGGLCGDDARFEKTLLGYNESPKEGEVLAIAFYGESLEITKAQFGGWTPFGPERIITRSADNILYELDEKPALQLYKKYLGEKASQLPQSALLYPLSVKSANKEEAIVRTILSIDEDNNAMILAGDVPEGSMVQLMMANIDKIAEGAAKAAELGMATRRQEPELAILISCIGRKLVMDQRVEEEIEEVREVIGTSATITGFYSYGELAPFNGSQKCELHNQTMTLTLFSE
ncbi:FIST C-terminal domain-containing protein [Aquimarina sp. ERC-38]|uniref:FIST signal transduction protein n=1 Tax=Aquimarina sp. ERC-38 TaxID=2949996 RepID=UPI002248620E|nr:FIST N-terminal domain-containing protein [Aquimarina sp. ERC-38]UZO82252.1 FIST C-terminal domain-containing protein [Aquimarina sp. ERC-38]